MSNIYGGFNNIFGPWATHFTGFSITDIILRNKSRSDLVVAESPSRTLLLVAGEWVTTNFYISGIDFVDPGYCTDAVVVGCSLSDASAKGYIGAIAYQLENVYANDGELNIKCSYLSSESESVDVQTRFYLSAQYA